MSTHRAIPLSLRALSLVCAYAISGFAPVPASAQGRVEAHYEATLAGIPVGRLRDLVASAASLAAARGTAGGLCQLLSTVTGVPGFAVDEPPEHAFHLVVRVPPAAAGHLDLIRRVVAAEKPAATTSEVVLDAPST